MVLRVYVLFSLCTALYQILVSVFTWDCLTLVSSAHLNTVHWLSKPKQIRLWQTLKKRKKKKKKKENYLA